jgi:hypothetical protein
MNPPCRTTSRVTKKLLTLVTPLAAAIGVAATAVPAAAQGFVATPVVRSGDAAPGTPAGVTFGLVSGATDPAPFIGPTINSPGDVAFLAHVTGSGITANVNDIGIWSTSGGTVQLVIRDGDSVPIGSGNSAPLAQINTFPPIGLSGPVAYRGTLVVGGAVTTANDTGIWAQPPAASMTLIAREGDTAAGTGGATFTSFGDPLLQSGNTAIVPASLLVGGAVTTANDSGLWFGTSGNLQLFVREGDPAPGAGGATFSGAPVATAVPSGTIAFRFGLTGTGVTSANNIGIWAGSTPASVQLVMRAGDIAPTIGTAVTAFNGVAVLADGSVAINATAATGGSVTTANNQGLFVGLTQPTLQLVARKGDQAPGQPAGVVLNGIGVPIANGNTVGFRTSVTGTGVTTANDSAIFTWSATTGLTTVAREGDAAPGAGGALFGQLGTSSPLGFGQLFSIGPNGQAAFYAPLTGSGVTTTNDTGIWAQTSFGVQLVIRKGDQVDLDPGLGTDLATVTNLSLLDNGPSGGFGTSGGYASVGGNGQVTWAATFADGRSAVFVSVAPVPEPTAVLTVAAVVSALGAFTARRWTRAVGLRSSLQKRV